jgi:hypothetical protein
MSWCQGCQIYLDTKYQNVEKSTKLPLNIPNSRKIDKIAIKYIYRLLPVQDPPKFTQIGIFGFENIPSGNPAWQSYGTTAFQESLVEYVILRLKEA